MQLNVLNFIRSLSSLNAAKTHSETGVEVTNFSGKRRTTSALIAGKGKILGDIVSFSTSHYEHDPAKRTLHDRFDRDVLFDHTSTDICGINT